MTIFKQKLLMQQNLPKEYVRYNYMNISCNSFHYNDLNNFHLIKLQHVYYQHDCSNCNVLM